MEALAALFVQNPAALLLVAGLFFGAYLLAQRWVSVPRPAALLWPAVAWSVWAAWETLIALFSPEANIRVDLLVIVPVVLLVSAVGIVMSFVRRKTASTHPA